jgi:diacylglycerol kinase family enzyme
VNALVLMNAGAGTVLRGREDLPDRVRSELREAGVAAEVVCTPGTTLRDQALSAVGRGFDTVVAAGGDGTIGTVASALVGTDMPLGVLPLGTRNHFARDLGLPSELPAAVRALRDTPPRPVDVGEVNGRVFVNNASIGLYPQIVQERDERRILSGLPKGPATLLATLNVLRRFWLVRVRIEVEGRSVVSETPFVFVGNNEYRMNLFDLGVRQCLDAGTLSIYTAHCTRRGSLLRLAFLALAGRLEQAANFDSHCVTEAWLETRRRYLRVALDGEILRLTPPLHFRARPGELRVIAPLPPSPAA